MKFRRLSAGVAVGVLAPSPALPIPARAALPGRKDPLSRLSARFADNNRSHGMNTPPESMGDQPAEVLGDPPS